MKKSSFEFDVLVHGSSAKEYYHKGNYYIEGKEGTRFSIRMRNNSNGQVLFVPTVDGLSIINGKEASFKSSGYIVGAYDSLTISGWRTSDDNVSEFYFSSPTESYAGKMKTASNLGVIGCAVFKEKNRQPIISQTIVIEKGHRCTPFCLCTLNTLSGTVNIPAWNSPLSAVVMCASNNTGGSFQTSAVSATCKGGLGTGFGEDKYSPVVTVEFEKESFPSETFSIFYDTRKNLEEQGIEFKKPVYVTPSAFPKEDSYCKRPVDSEVKMRVVSLKDRFPED